MDKKQQSFCQTAWQAAKETPYMMLVEPFVVLWGWLTRKATIQQLNSANEEICQLKQKLHIAIDECRQWKECCQRVQRDYDMAYETVRQEFDINSYNYKTRQYEPLCEMIRRIPQKEA